MEIQLQVPDLLPTQETKRQTAGRQGNCCVECGVGEPVKEQMGKESEIDSDFNGTNDDCVVLVNTFSIQEVSTFPSV